MDNSLLMDLVHKFCCGDDSAFYEIYNQFEKLIVKYSNHCDDDKQEMILCLIETLKSGRLDKVEPTTPDAVQRYIAVVLRNRYIYLQKEKRRNSQNVELDEGIQNMLKCFDSVESNILFRDCLQNLSTAQKDVIIYRYVYGFTDAEIGNLLKITRQAVNRLRLRSFKILKTYWKG